MNFVAAYFLTFVIWVSRFRRCLGCNPAAERHGEGLSLWVPPNKQAAHRLDDRTMCGRIDMLYSISLYSISPYWSTPRLRVVEGGRGRLENGFEID